MTPLTEKHAQLLKSNRALLLTFERFPVGAKLSAVGLALVIGVYSGISALTGTASNRVQLCIRNKQALQCVDKAGKPYIMTEYHAEKWKANPLVVVHKKIPATNPHKALWMALAGCSFWAAGAGFRSLQNSERQLANYEVIAEKRDLAKGQLNARVELLEDWRAMRIKEVQAEGDVEATANDCAVVIRQCEVLGEADIRIAQLDAEEAIFEAETAGLPEDKKREYVEFLRNQKNPFQLKLTGTQTFDGINNPSDKIESQQANEPKIPKLIWYPSVLVYGAPGSGKTFFSEQEVGKRLEAGHKVIVLDPHAAYGAWQGCEVIGGGMNYAAIDAKLAWFSEEVAKRYKDVQSKPNPQFQPLTFVCDEFTRWGGKCPNSTDFFEQLVTDIRKVEMFGLIISHTRTLAGLANAKGFASLRDEALLEVEILGNKDEETGRATPRLEAKIKLPGQHLSDRTVVKLTKHPTPNKPEQTSQNTSAESTTDYLNRVFKLEFDLGKPETEPETVSDEFHTLKQPHSSNSNDSNAVYFTALKLDRARAIELILKLKNEMKHTQTEIIWMLWNARPGKTKAYETAISEYKELLAEGEEGNAK